MPKPTAPADPLADLRQQDPTPAGLTSSPEPQPDEPEPGPLAELLPLDELWHDAAVDATVKAWHNDETAASYLHHGGTCGCRFVARLAILAVHGEPVEPDDDETTPED